MGNVVSVLVHCDVRRSSLATTLTYRRTPTAPRTSTGSTPQSGLREGGYIYYPATRLICLENTHVLEGNVYPYNTVTWFKVGQNCQEARVMASFIL
ncbi:hypothetical protein Zm00014a_031235 [Zea mays]|uniref:Uncharacterized protein n=1 Tax=Zea mays TaxID=4577 RepID=A0A3L6G3X5_MAIZE|nr:hypothetical protein Zm00014a_031235 [Zea mays]